MVPWECAITEISETPAADIRAQTANKAQFVHNEWIESYDPTIEDTYRTQINVDVCHKPQCLNPSV
jgi:hypothetical protein